MEKLNIQNTLEKTVAYFYNEHYGSYFGVVVYKLNSKGHYDCGIPSGCYDKELMDKHNIPYMGVKKENKNILYL